MAIEVTPPSPATAVHTKSTTSQDGPMFSLRIVNLEYYLSPPLPGMDVCYSKFQGRTVSEVPVVRIYGSTPAGQKACLHLHQVFPYFYVPYDDDLPQDISDALAYVRSLASAIEKAMKLASSNAAKKQHVHSCSLVTARRYYGYYPSEQLFIKIVLYHPQEVARISTLLLGGGIMNRKFQPHESHISYLLQLLIDQNLAGMSFIHLSSVKFRRPIPERPSDTVHVIQQLKAEFTPTAQSSTPAPAPCSMETTPPSAEFRSHVWVESSIPAHWVWPANSSTSGPFGRHSTCELEVDATVEDILNRQELVFVPLHEAGPAVKLVQSLTPMWEEERLRTGDQGPAGAAAAQPPSPDRVLPTPSALEQALRDSLFQIVQDEKRFHQSEEELQKSTQEMLLKYSQAANAVRSEGEPRLDTKSIGVEGGWSQRSEEELVNEQIIRSQLTPQGLASQEAEAEVAELLEWMGASQERSSDDDEEEALEIRQTWDSPTMEAAMLQALSKFEQATQKECQEILDCVNNEDDDDGEEDLEAALLEINLEDMARRYIPQVDGASDRYPQHVQKQHQIPQNDGADDDETEPDLKRMRVGSKKDVPKRPVWGMLPLVGASSQPAKVKQEKKELRASKPLNLRPRKEANRQPEEKVKESEVSLRALMRRKRERRRKEASVSGGSSILGSQSEGEQSFGVVKSESSLSESQEQLVKENVEEVGTVPGQRLPSDAETVTRSSPQDVGTGVVCPVEDVVDYNVHEAGDHRDCGGGGAVDLIGEDLLLTQPKASKVEPDDIELAEVASLAWAEVVKEITAAKVTLHARSVDILPSEALSEGEHVIETQLVEHEILWRLKQDEVSSVEAGEDELIGTIPVGDFKIKRSPHEEIKDSLHEEIEDSPDEVIQDSPDEVIQDSPDEEIEDSSPKIGNSDAASDKEGFQTGLLFTDMSDVSQDSFDWGGEFGGSHRLDESDEGAFASEDDMPDVKPEQANGIAPVPDSEHALSEAHEATDGEALQEMFSSKSSSQVKLGVRMSNFSSGTDFDEHNLLRPADENEDESGAVLHNAISGSGQELITIPVKFCQKPPSRDALMASLGQHNLREVDYGGVFYGNAKDVPGRATVSAGLIFDVKSREPQDLAPFLFGAENKKSRFSFRTKPADLTPGMGIPCHYENDGSVSYLLTPAKPPPSRLAVQRWLSENHVPENRTHSRGERVFTMDANTGKLVPIDEAGSNGTTQEEEEEDVEYFRPASPKYDERHVLATPMSASPAYTRSTKRRSSGVDGTPAFKGPLLSSEATTSGDGAPKSRLLETSSQDEKNVECTPPPLPKEDEVKVELPREKPKDIPKSASRDVSQITAPSPLKGQLTPLSQSGFRDPASVGAGQQITLMSIEVHSETRGNLRPDPRYDAIGMVVVDIQYDDETRGHLNNQTVVLLVDAKAASSPKNVDGVTGCSIIYLTDELQLLKCFVRLVRLSDPDMLVGWEVQGASLGLLAERAANLGLGLLKELSRIPPKPQTPKPDEEKVQELRNSVFIDMVPLETESVITDEWGRTNGSGLFVGGRIVLNLWRIMRGEVKLGIYTLEAVAEAVLRRRVPRIPWRTLTRWFSRGSRFQCIEYFVDRARLNFAIMDQIDLLNRTAELARVFGIDFYSVFSRGSQYRVESMMLRLAHTQNFLLLSPSRQQVAAQPAMECLPLVMEPESRFYTSPVVVLDFQSLYPSMIIAYNLCFSTCLGKIVSNNPKVLGVTNLPIPPGLLQDLKDLLTITPNGVMYTPPEVRQGVVPRLLSEILSTRIMVKQAMKKLTPDRRVLQRVLNARQFALKLIANVTYGYTAAGFSGRMPFAELADSIVQCGRLTLERAIHLVNTTERWDARVVYGDTDSMFVHLEGRTREEAFRIGQDIAASVTALNPTPVTLKMEKVYHPCVLLTKKRYVGYSYESPGQASPTFDAKGIETIRRDSCAAVAKTLERSLRTLFETQDLSQVKAYLQRQWSKIISGRVSLRDFVFAKEVRLGTYSARAAVLPAAAIVASKAMSLDPRAEPRYAERVPYVVVHGEPGARLSDVVVDPHTMLAHHLRLHDTYYITKQIIPALQRVLGLVGADLRQWYAELPRVYRPPTAKRPGKKHTFEAGKGATIDHYYLSQHCAVCGELMRGSQVVCSACAAHPQAVVSVLTTQTARLEMEFKHLEAICRHCGGGDGRPEGHIACVSLDCPIFFERLKVHKEFQALSTVSATSGYYPTCFLDFGSELF